MKFRCTITFTDGLSMVSSGLDLDGLKSLVDACAKNGFHIAKIELCPVS